MTMMRSISRTFPGKFLGTFVLGAFVLSMMLSQQLSAETLQLKKDYPERYVVVRGDTLWDISAKFLKDPWQWPEIWRLNDDIKNPHLIYPGDVISLIFRDGKPVLVFNQRVRPTVKLSPQVRVTKLDNAVAPMALKGIKEFLNKARLLNEEALAQAGYVARIDQGHLIAGKGDRVYVRNMNISAERKYAIYKIGAALRNPGARKKDILGYEATHIADGHFESSDDPAVFVIDSSVREVLKGYRVLEVEEYYDEQYFPHAPDQQLNGTIISVLEERVRLGANEVAVINLGQQQGAEVGHVLAIFRTPDAVRDTFALKRKKKRMVLPQQKLGHVMVFRVLDHVSYVFILDAQREIKRLDKVANPGRLSF